MWMPRLEDRYVIWIDEEIDLAIRITNEPPPGLSASGRRYGQSHFMCHAAVFWRNMALRPVRSGARSGSAPLPVPKRGSGRHPPCRFQQGNEVGVLECGTGVIHQTTARVRPGGVKSHPRDRRAAGISRRCNSLESGEICGGSPLIWNVQNPPAKAGMPGCAYPPSRYQPPHMTVFRLNICERSAT